MVKTPDEVSDYIKEEMTELIIQLRSSAVKMVMLSSLWGDDLREVEEQFTNDDLEQLDAIQIWMRWKDVSDAEAIIEAACYCKLITEVKCGQLRERLDL